MPPFEQSSPRATAATSTIAASTTLTNLSLTRRAASSGHSASHLEAATTSSESCKNSPLAVNKSQSSVVATAALLPLGKDSIHLSSDATVSTSSSSSSSSSLSSSTSSRSSSSPTRDVKDDYYITRNALTTLNDTIHSVLEGLSRAGVSQAALNELSKELSLRNYCHVLQQAFEYTVCLYGYFKTNKKNSNTVTNSTSSDAIVLLHDLISSWEALNRYLLMQHRQAHRHYYMLRRLSCNTETTVAKVAPNTASNTTSCSNDNKKADTTAAGRLRRGVMASGVLAGFRGLKQQSSAISTSSPPASTKEKQQLSSSCSSNTITQAQVEQALKRKLELAEACCSCQKGLLVAQNWRQRL